MLHGWPGSVSTVYNIPNAITLNNGAFWEEDGVQHLQGAVTIGGSGGTLYASWNNKYLYVDGVIGGSGPLTLGNNGTGNPGNIDISSANSYSGTVSFNNGVVVTLNNANAFANAAVNANGATFAYGQATASFAGLQGSGNVATPSGALTVGGNNLNTTYSGLLTGAGALLKTGSGVLTLSNTSSYAGGTTVSGGTLVINPNLSNNGSSLIGSGTLTVNPGATVETYVNSFGYNAPFLPVVVNGGLLNQLYTGAVGPDSHIGAITLSGGTMSGTQFDLHSGVTTLASSAASIMNFATLSLQANNTFNVAAYGSAPPDLTVSANITGGYAIAKQGPGFMVLSGTNNTYSGGTTVRAGTLQLGSSSALGSTTANLAVNGGLLDLHGYNAGATVFSGSGGGIDNLAPSSTSTVTLGNGNASGSYAGTILSSVGAISLVKAGSGALALTGNNLYAGTTTVNGGLLVVTGSHTGGGAYTINGGTLGGFGTISAPVTLNATAGLAPGIAGIGTMSLGGLSIAGANNNVLFDLTNNPLAGNDEVAVAGGLSLAGTTTISINKLNTTLGSNVSYPLFTYSSLSGNPATQLALASSATVLTSRQSFTFSASSNTVYLNISGAAQTLVWNGSGSNTWDNGNANFTWLNNVNNPDIFVLGDNVIFSNSGSQTNVTVNAAVIPNTVLVTGSNNYTLSGSGSIGGITTPLTMQGTGVLTLGTTGNSYGGGTLVQSGTLALGAANALPTAGAVVLGTTGSAGTLDLAGFNQQIGTLAVGSGATPALQIIGNSSTSSSATLTIAAGAFDLRRRDPGHAGRRQPASRLEGHRQRGPDPHRPEHVYRREHRQRRQSPANRQRRGTRWVRRAVCQPKRGR